MEAAVCAHIIILPIQRMIVFFSLNSLKPPSVQLQMA